MQKIRTLHLYIGTFFAPLLIYFCLSGFWQIFHLHMHPKGVDPTALQHALRALSNPHMDGTLPGLDPKSSASILFRVFSATMALGLFTSALLGIRLALLHSSRRKTVVWSLVLGVTVPLALILIHG